MFARTIALLFLLFTSLLQGVAAAGAPISAAHTGAEAIGRQADYLQESGGPLTLAQAVAAQRAGKFTPSPSGFLNFGIGARPAWIHFSVDNPAAAAARLRLSVEAAWLDRVDVHFVRDGRPVAEYRSGDRSPLASRPVDSRYYAFDHDFAAGGTEVFIRVETPDPMMVPLYLMSAAQAQAREQLETYSYGFLYGFLFALLVYNAVLSAGLRDSRYLAYSLYLGAFLLMNAAYTGHGFRWLWPDHFQWAQWSNPVLMVLYATSGLLFALSFLDAREHFPRMYKAVLAYIAAAASLLLVTVLMDSQLYALLLAFDVTLLFPVIMLGMGAWAARSGKTPARYFLLAAIAAMIGAAVTALAVRGVIPANVWTYRAVDMGILVDATLLALALTYQLRIGQEEKLRAEQLATLDPLTGMHNRRAFYAKATPIWNIAQRNGRDLAAILLDIDSFKHINDAYGHAAGDAALTAVARAVSQAIRQQDVAARWGGEEFILLLPETSLDEAAALAERLRAAIAAIRLEHAGAEIAMTASFGVAQREPHYPNLDALISAADKYLYQSKAGGRNRISCALEAVAA